MKGGESLGDEESSKEEEEVVPALILASGVRPLAPDVKSYVSCPHVIDHLGCTYRPKRNIPIKNLNFRRLGGPPAMRIAVRPWQSEAQTRRLFRRR